MSKEELLSDQTFMNLFGIANSIERTQKELELREQAKKNGCAKEFSKLFNAWQKEIRNQKESEKH